MKLQMPMKQTLGLYLSIPFCRGKCTFCNFASDAFGASLLPAYIASLEREVADARLHAAELGAWMPEAVDTIYFGGGTPSLLSPGQIHQIFAVIRSHFALAADAETTVECAPGQLSDASLEQFVREGVNRLSFGAQSFVPEELQLAGRAHTAEVCLGDLARARAAGIERLSVDLIAGLPGQTGVSWRRSLEAVLASETGHASVYMLEVDEKSRLGREVLGGGSRYGAQQVASDDECAAMYEIACAVLEAGGLAQYEISNFARPRHRSRHNLKYWTRQPYLGIGLDAHSMLPLAAGGDLRFHNGDDLQSYIAEHGPVARTELRVLEDHKPTGDASARTERVTKRGALEETIFLTLRLNQGLDLHQLAIDFGPAAMQRLIPAVTEARCHGLVEIRQQGGKDSVIALTARGRALSNEVFGLLIEALDGFAVSHTSARELAVA